MNENSHDAAMGPQEHEEPVAPEQKPLQSACQQEQQQEQQQSQLPRESPHVPMSMPMPIPADPAQSFMWGAHNLFAGLHAVNARLLQLEQAQDSQSSHARFEQGLESLRAFAVSILRRLEAHENFIHNDRFLQGVDQRAYETVVTKCLPEVWELRANVDALREKLETKASVSTTQATIGTVALAKEVEDVLLRLAALGDERVQHLEIIGESGKRYKDGTARRRLVTEPALAAGVDYPKLPVPSAWKADSDTQTINHNFEQLSKMINEVVLARIDTVETNMDKRLSHIEKRVDVLQNLFQTLSRDIRSTSQPSGSLDKVVSRSELPETGSESALHGKINKETSKTANPRHPNEPLVQMSAGASSPGLGSAQIDIKGKQVSHIVTMVSDDVQDHSEAETSTSCTMTAQQQQQQQQQKHVSQSLQKNAGTGQQILERPKTARLSGAKAGRAAYNRAEESKRKR
ncbi:Hypothetical Protein FCC1311_022032 [Hondaea fermentalgiana]|uniref:Uncharacterized protein n=1 Tax=Hondaea fermentalgiana TaxID=2315210 RepID=A0A2R5GBM0_9STRA|nr:Hypothetical Protein FCC1311_022032 [Hondaea fermentalgiana]|eukprot:GBG25983.1 Hypothetical Protein FCC1311_022032 [Hondaea fermentalgiana]